MELLHNIKELTNYRLDASSISVLGTKLGDPKESVSRELALKEKHSVWLHADKGIALRFSQETTPRIVEYQFFPEVLTELEIKLKKHVQLAFGPADGIEIKQESTYYFYEKQQIVIAWDNEKDCLLSLYLGENSIQQTRYSIKEFLALFQKFKVLVPDSANWQLQQLKLNEPRYYRLKQLLSLMKAFNLGSDLLSDVYHRGFLKNRTMEDFEPVVQDMKEYVAQSKHEVQRGNIELTNLHSPFFDGLVQRFFRFSEEMRKMIAFNSDCSETESLTSRYSFFKTAKVLESIDLEALEEIEGLLHKILDPSQQVFSKSTLVEQFDFPDVDLEQIDAKNY